MALFPKTTHMCVCTSLQNQYFGLPCPAGVFVEKGLTMPRAARAQVKGPTVCDPESWGTGLMSPRAALSPPAVTFSGQEAHVCANTRGTDKAR